MTGHDLLPEHQSELDALVSRLPAGGALPGMTPAAIIELQQVLGLEIDYHSQVGHHAMDRDDAVALYDDLHRRLDESRSALIALARRDRTHPLQLSSWGDPRREKFADAIRSRLDLPTFIARHAGQTGTGFRRVDDALVCPCPLPEDTEVDSWLFVDPVSQTWCCTTCGSGDLFHFAAVFFGLRRVALYNLLAVEAGLPPIPPDPE